jgi:hypothetical protein
VKIMFSHLLLYCTVWAFVAVAGKGDGCPQQPPAANARLELDWSLLTLWCVCLVGQRELAAADAEPARLSATAVIRAFQSTLRDYRLRPLHSAETLWAKLRAALRDDYRRTSSKTSRNYPRKKPRHAIGAPTILHATKHQTKLTNALAPRKPNLRLTA